MTAFQWKDPLEAALALGALVDERAGTDTLWEALDRVEGLEAGDSTPFGGICGAFDLTWRERAAFAWCLYRAERFEPFPRPQELAELCRGQREETFPILLDPAAGCLLRTACDVCFGREPRLPEGLRLVVPDQEPCFHGRDLLDEADAFLQGCAREEVPAPSALALTGGAGTGKKYLLGQLCRRRGCSMLVADCAALSPEDLMQAAGLAVLFDALICLDQYEDRHAPLARGLFRWFSLLFLSCRREIAVPEGCASMLERAVPPLRYEERLAAMEALFGKGLPWELIAKTAALCGAPAGALVRAAARIRAEQAAGTLSAAALREALRRENSPTLSQNAQVLSSNKRLCDLVLPAEQKRQLENLCAFVRERETVWKKWGFERKIPGGQGLTALFYGASGTGKTMAAGVVANELGLELYRVDLSQLISKYIGETQKNIGRIFDDAEKADCILFFDEADALFSRRSDATDAQDRYANAEVAYLLQRTEQYDGVILLATNLLQNFDEAFRRRIGFMIHFPMPDAALREALWRGIFPEEAPVDELDYPLLAKHLELSGAGIRACALNAARMAAADGGAIHMGRLTAAARDEYQKLGKSFPAVLSQRFPQERSWTDEK